MHIGIACLATELNRLVHEMSHRDDGQSNRKAASQRAGSWHPQVFEASVGTQELCPCVGLKHVEATDIETFFVNCITNLKEDACRFSKVWLAPCCVWGILHDACSCLGTNATEGAVRCKPRRGCS